MKQGFHLFPLCDMQSHFWFVCYVLQLSVRVELIAQQFQFPLPAFFSVPLRSLMKKTLFAHSYRQTPNPHIMIF